MIGAGLYERTEFRTAPRNGFRPRTLTTTAGDLELRIPKLRAGSFLPSLLERRRRIDQALFAVVMEAYLHGVSTRKVDDLIRALGPTRGSASLRSAESAPTWMPRSLLPRPIAGQNRILYVFLDATYCKAWVNRRGGLPGDRHCHRSDVRPRPYVVTFVHTVPMFSSPPPCTV